jgi:hypothetical protein
VFVILASIPYSAKSICKRYCGKYSTYFNNAPIEEAIPLIAAIGGEKMSNRVQEWTVADNLCHKNWLTKARKKGWCRGPDDIDHRAHIGGSPLMVGLPIRYRFVQIKNRLIVTETDLIKQRHVAPKLFPNEEPVVSPHRNDEVGTFDQFPGQLSWDMCGEIRAFLTQPGLNPGMHGLRLRIDPSRVDKVGRIRAEVGLERILCRYTPENIPRTDE